MFNVTHYCFSLTLFGYHGDILNKMFVTLTPPTNPRNIFDVSQYSFPLIASVKYAYAFPCCMCIVSLHVHCLVACASPRCVCIASLCEHCLIACSSSSYKCIVLLRVHSTYFRCVWIASLHEHCLIACALSHYLCIVSLRVDF